MTSQVCRGPARVDGWAQMWSAPDVDTPRGTGQSGRTTREGGEHSQGLLLAVVFHSKGTTTNDGGGLKRVLGNVPTPSWSWRGRVEACVLTSRTSKPGGRLVGQAWRAMYIRDVVVEAGGEASPSSESQPKPP